MGFLTKPARQKALTALSLATLVAGFAFAPAQAVDAGQTSSSVTQDTAAEIYAANGEPTSLISPQFYEAPATLPQENGKLIKSEPMKFWKNPQKTIPGNSKTATRIMYTTTNHKGEKVATTGTALTSKKEWKGGGERPIVVAAPGTQGLGDSCAPSNQLEAGTEYEYLAISPLLDAGYNVVVPDYIGSGTAGTHSYMNRVDQGNAVLDAARAAFAPELGMGKSSAPIGIWGYSQGGGAAASAGELQPEYAPELNLKGIFAGAVTADLGAITKKIDGTMYNGFMLMGMVGLGDSYGIDYSSYVNAEGAKIVEKTREVCTMGAIEEFGKYRNTGIWSKSGQKVSQIMETDPTFQKLVQENRLGVEGRAPEVPILIASTWGDDVVPHSTNRDLAKSYCKEGTRVSFYMDSTPMHALAMIFTIPRGLIFMDRQFKGLPSSEDCWQVGA